MSKNKLVIKIQIFISYKWEDNRYFNGMKGLLNNPNNRYVHYVLSERDDLRNKGKNVVESHLKENIRNCNRVICLVGEDTQSSKWVQWELEVATSQNKKIIAVRIPRTTGGAPRLIRERNISVIKWKADEVNKGLK